MKPHALLASVLLLHAGGASAQTPCNDLDSLAWMLGDWRQQTEGTVFTERWRLAEDGTMVGTASSRPVGGEEIYQQEVMTLVMVSGVPVYRADPDHGGSFVEFTLVACDERSAVFENPDHDFPQRLAYRLNDEGGLDASVTDLEGKGFELSFLPDGDPMMDDGD